MVRNFEDFEEWTEKNPPKRKLKLLELDPGEKIHEQMISIDDAPFTYEYKDYYKIFPSINLWSKKLNKINKGKKVSKNLITDQIPIKNGCKLKN